MKRILVLLMCFNIVLAPTYVFATTLASDGWSVSKRLVQGATTFYDGTKNIVLNGKNYAATGTAAITPAAGQVAKMIVRTGAVLAVDLAIKTLIGAVDYVMDLANNEVVYKKVVDPQDIPPYAQYYYADPTRTNFCTSISTCNSVVTQMGLENGWTNNGCVAQSTGRLACALSRDGDTTTQYMDRYVNENYDPNAVPHEQEQRLGYDAVAAQLMSDAMAEKPEAKAYVSSVADTALEQDEQRQIVPAIDVIQQLSQSQAIPTSNTATGQAAVQPTTDPATGEPTTSQPAPYNITINFPEACGWMPSICSGLQSVVNYLNGFNTWLNEFGKDTSLPNNEKPEFETQSVSPTENYISWAASCPPDAHVPVELYGTHSTITFSWAPWCELLSIIKPAIVFSAYMGAAFIVLGLRT